MNHLDQLKKQHESINEIIIETTKLVNEKKLDANASEIAKNISILAGKLQIHLSHEDQHLYPSLLKSDSADVKHKATMYVHEMGDLKAVFTEFKNQFNTKSKILTEPNKFETEFSKVFGAIEKRMKKEDTDLYLMLG